MSVISAKMHATWFSQRSLAWLEKEQKAMEELQAPHQSAVRPFGFLGPTAQEIENTLLGALTGERFEGVDDAAIDFDAFNREASTFDIGAFTGNSDRIHS